MRKQIALYRACYYTGLIWLGRRWIQRSGPRLIVLNYHRAADGDLRRHFLYLRRHYRILHFEQAVEELYISTQKSRNSDRRTLLAITFDDGYHDNYTHAYPLARELEVPITIFLNPGYIENSRYFWWMEGDYLVQHARVAEATIDGILYHLAESADQKALSRTIYERACHAGSVAEREAFLADVRAILNVSEAVLPGEQVALTWSEVQEMEASGWVSFGAHTMHHPVLGYLNEPQEIEQEVKECRDVMEHQLGHPVRTFAYPFGRAEHYGPVGLTAVEKAGYSGAATTITGINTPQSDPRQLHRLACDAKLHWLLVAARTAGVAQAFAPLFPYGIAVFTMGARLGAWGRARVWPGYQPRKKVKRWSWSA